METGSVDEKAKEMLANIWRVEGETLPKGAWLWWFWIFFIHDKDTEKTGKCRQLMILWSVKNDAQIDCNGLDIRVKKQISALEGNRWALDGAAAAWYFDGKHMRENFVLERSGMGLDSRNRSLIAPGATPSEFYEKDGEYFVKIKSGAKKFEFRARQTDMNPEVGPNHGDTRYPFGMRIEGTRIEVLKLGGHEEDENGRHEITGTAYFQKILLAVPPPQWFWGIYHFPDGSYFTFMQPYVGRAAIAGNWNREAKLKRPTVPVMPEGFFYHAPTGRVYRGGVSVHPEKIYGRLWRHTIKGSGDGFRLSAVAEGYSHACWTFTKWISSLPMKSKFHYNEYPAVLKKLVIRLDSGEELVYEHGWGNMENSWGFLI